MKWLMRAITAIHSPFLFLRVHAILQEDTLTDRSFKYLQYALDDYLLRFIMQHQDLEKHSYRTCEFCILTKGLLNLCQTKGGLKAFDL